jgi:hypothetical protein
VVGSVNGTAEPVTDVAFYLVIGQQGDDNKTIHKFTQTRKKAPTNFHQKFSKVQGCPTRSPGRKKRPKKGPKKGQIFSPY